MTDKPQGKDGPIRFGADGATWIVTQLPDDKVEREQLVADLFVSGFDNWVATESEPTLRPLGKPLKNKENDLDFSIATGLGDMLMELAEFAPLNVHGRKFEFAPKSLPSRSKAELATALVERKSARQGGANRFLVLYVTEHGFWLDPFAIEWMRRFLSSKAPHFDRVYYVSVHGLTQASVSEIYPGQPHHACVGKTDEELDAFRIITPHPMECIVGASGERTIVVDLGVTGTEPHRGKPD